MKRADALQEIFYLFDKNDIVVSTTGLISREIFEKFDSERNLYFPGSMGLVASVGLGLSLCRTDRRVIVIDGDASLLMNLNSLMLIGTQLPPNLIHFVLDNRAYGSCSEEKSLSDQVNLEGLAKFFGYRYTYVVTESGILRSIYGQIKDGPALIVVKIQLGGRRDFVRPNNLPQIKNRFYRFLSITPKERRKL